jgi:hypothetical protein
VILDPTVTRFDEPPDVWRGEFILLSEISHIDFEVSKQSKSENKYE